MAKQAIFSGSPVAGAPYSPGVKSGNLVFVSGQIPMDPATGKLIEATFEEKVLQCIKNVEGILTAAGASMDDVVKVTVFLKDMDDFGKLNSVYKDYWGAVKPARSCVQVAKLPLDVPVEIEAIAVL